MKITVEAIYECGKLVLPKPLPLPEQARVIATIETQTAGSDAERMAWSKLSQESLAKAWDNSGDDVFNALLKE